MIQITKKRHRGDNPDTWEITGLASDQLSILKFALGWYANSIKENLRLLWVSSEVRLEGALFLEEVEKLIEEIGIEKDEYISHLMNLQ